MLRTVSISWPMWVMLAYLGLNLCGSEAAKVMSSHASDVVVRVEVFLFFLV